jgi:radical SAM superfamily enzyme YgiQ (UPF0313 family)
VGVNASFTSNVYSAYKVLEQVKEYDPNICRVVGGHHATLCSSDFTGKVDAVVLGEGELTTSELLGSWEKGRSLDEVEGIAFQDNGEWKQTKPRKLIENLDDAPLPARNLVAHYQENYFQGSWQPCAYVETARGCPYRCKFCSVWKFYQGGYRARSPERVVQELESIAAPYVVFSDDNFLANPSRAEKICQAILKAKIKKHFIMQVRADAIVKYTEVLKEWIACGLRTVFVGFEAFSQRQLDKLRKHTSIENNEQAAGILKKLGIGVMSSFIVDPDFGKEEFTKLKGYIRRVRFPLPVFSVLTPLPGTDLYQEKEKELTTKNYELFDLQHAVTTPRLGFKKFYDEYGGLYRSCYLNLRSFLGLVRRFWSRNLFKRLWGVVRVVRDYKKMKEV